MDLLSHHFLSLVCDFCDPSALGRVCDQMRFISEITTLKMASGPLHAFPWLDLTTLAHFADHHFYFTLMHSFGSSALFQHAGRGVAFSFLWWRCMRCSVR
jgi:hypothetical protein